MKSILESFAYGELNPNEGYVDNNTQYKKALGAIANYEEEIMTLLKDDEKDMLIKLSSEYAHINSIESIDKFIQGYRIGVKMMAEVFVRQKDEIYPV